ncbi:MAG: sigma-70 family RNA polymerase sigma factor [Clostridia bacterium]|nr:sigma-70 family RNA polymerase sigma factor [Clostridia bacterium]
MDDNKIIELYFARDERAIEETRASYGRLIYSVAYNILTSAPDSEECENDTYLRTWESIPPTRPNIFSAYLSRISRNLALNRLRDEKRRRPLGTELIIDELAEALPDTAGDPIEEMELREALNGFLESLGKTARMIFVKRYFYMRQVKEIARELGISAGSVKITLWRVRKSLRDYLESRGIVI